MTLGCPVQPVPHHTLVPAWKPIPLPFDFAQSPPVVGYRHSTWGFEGMGPLP